MEQTKTRNKAKAKNDVKALRSEQWLSILEASEYIGISVDNFNSYLEDGYFMPSRSLEGGEPLIFLESIDDFLKNGQRARPSQAKMQIEQQQRRELREIGDSLKRSVSIAIGDMEQKLPKLKAVLERSTIDQIVNQASIGAAHEELSKIRQKSGI